MTDLRADFIFDVGRKLLHTPCRWAAQRGSVVTVPCYSARRTNDGIVRRVEDQLGARLRVRLHARRDRSLKSKPLNWIVLGP